MSLNLQGGVFIVLSYSWGYVVDGFMPDLGDIIGSVFALAGVALAWFWPRTPNPAG
jgi:drug/metabolite transporter superfamily protein YnfA